LAPLPQQPDAQQPSFLSQQSHFPSLQHSIFSQHFICLQQQLLDGVVVVHAESAIIATIAIAGANARSEKLDMVIFLCLNEKQFRFQAKGLGGRRGR
jgi:hypothetical protein